MLREETDSRLMSFAAKVWRKLFYRQQWFLQVEFGVVDEVMPNLQRTIPLYPPPDRFWADPFLLSRHNLHYVFVEELFFSSSKGHISVLELSATGRLNSVRTVLERPYHLSYPFLFEWDGVLYMLPESGQNQAVELYRCIEFPNKWALDRVLLADIRWADATLFEHQGYWWMFITQAAPGHSLDEHLYLYRADTPLGPFRAHVGNPVKSGLRGTRSAGALFSNQGILYRPAQDCTRVYGEAVVIQRVDELSSTAFRETEVGYITPDQRSEVRRMHTMNSEDGIRVTDAMRWIAK
jgi:hypothetical protein